MNRKEVVQMNRMYIEGDSGKELVVPIGTVISIEELNRSLNILLGKEVI